MLKRTPPVKVIDTNTVGTVLFAACCLFAIGSMAGSLDSTVPGEPTDVIDVDTESLPLPSDGADEVKQSLQSEGQADGEPIDNQQQPADDGETAPAPSDGDGSGEPRSADGQDGDSGGAAEQLQSAASGGEEPARSLLQRLLDYLLPALAGLLVLAALVYKREWFLERLRAYLGAEEAPAETGESGLLSIRSPNNEVERCWLEMVSRVEAAEDPSATPRERAEAVARAGLDRDAVDDLTGLYESVRYGDRTVTDDLVDQASTHLQRSTGEADD